MTRAVYVNMTDSFLSGWGPAKGGRAAYCIICDTWDQAEAIAKAAADRKDMKRVAFADKPRRATQVTIKHVSELGPSWWRYMPQQPASA